MAGYTILLIEDSEADARLVFECFPGVGEDVEFCRATTVNEGLELCNVRTFDLVLLDLNLPARSGNDFLREVRANPRLRNLPVVVFSGSAAPEDITRAYADSANAYIVKPRDLATLHETLGTTRSFWLETAKRPPAESLD